MLDLLDSEARPLILMGGGIVILGFLYFALRFWISRRGVVRLSTPALDRRNAQVLDQMTRGEKTPAESAAPDALLRAVEDAEKKPGA